MDWWIILVLLFGSLLILMFSGLSVAFSFLLVSSGGVYFLMGGTSGLTQLIVSIFDSLTKFNLTAIPFFILMGEVLYHAGLVSKALDVFSKWVGAIPGRLSIVTFLIGGLFAALSGATVASTAVRARPVRDESNKPAGSDPEGHLPGSVALLRHRRCRTGPGHSVPHPGHLVQRNVTPQPGPLAPGHLSFLIH